jgi:mono/diheme cytochrome c family protein
MKRLIAATAAVVTCSFAALGSQKPPANVQQGRVLYTRYCASCHGLDADGHGPVAPALSRLPVDLRRLAAGDGGPLRVDRIARYVDGREDVAAHGPRDMPVWGERFHAPEETIDPRIRAIVLYLDSIQKRDAPAGAR